MDRKPDSGDAVPHFRREVAKLQPLRALAQACIIEMGVGVTKRAEFDRDVAPLQDLCPD